MNKFFTIQEPLEMFKFSRFRNALVLLLYSRDIIKHLECQEKVPKYVKNRIFDFSCKS